MDRRQPAGEGVGGLHGGDGGADKGKVTAGAYTAMIHLMKQAADRPQGPELTTNQVVGACLYGLVFALFVSWHRFLG
jgi:hypothetical protein